MLRRSPFFCKVFLLSLLVCGVFSPFSAVAASKNFLKAFSSYKSSLTTIFPNDSVIPNSVFEEACQFPKGKIKLVKESLEKAFGHIIVSQKTVENILKAVSYLSKFRNYFFNNNESVYVYNRAGFFAFDFQVYIDGTVFIHLGEKDPKKAHGGFKEFSRSLRLEDNKLFGSLRFSLSDKNKVEDLKEELKIMRAMEKVPHNLGFDYFGIYEVSSTDKEKYYEGIFQTKLYQSTLEKYTITKTSIKDLMTLLLQAAKAVESFHKKGYAHRDIKQDNFLVNSFGMGKYDLTLADYGLSEKASLTSTINSLIGTKAYKDPYFCELERIDTQHKLGFRDKKNADIFSLGMVFYEMMFYNRELKDLNKGLNIEARKKFKGFYETNCDEIDLEKQIKLERKWIEERNEGIAKNYIAYSKAHAVFLKKIEHHKKNSDIMYNSTPEELKKLILKMISPIPEERPSVKRVIHVLTGLMKRL